MLSVMMVMTMYLCKSHKKTGKVSHDPNGAILLSSSHKTRQDTAFQ